VKLALKSHEFLAEVKYSELLLLTLRSRFGEVQCTISFYIFILRIHAALAFYDY